MLIIFSSIYSICNPFVYSTDVLIDNKTNHFDDTYKVYLKDNKYGKISIKYEENIDSYMVHAEFKKAGTTSFILEDKNKVKETLTIDSLEKITNILFKLFAK